MSSLAEVRQDQSVLPAPDADEYAFAGSELASLEKIPASNAAEEVVARSGYGLQLLQVGLPIWFADMLAITISLALGLVVSNLLGKQTNHFLPFVSGSIALYTLCFWSAGVYPGVGIHPARELKQLFRCLLTGAGAVVVGVLILANWRAPYFTIICVAFPLQWILFPVVRSFTKAQMRKFGLGVPFFFLGKRADVQRVRADMSRFGWTMLKPIGRFSRFPSDEFEGSIGEDENGSSNRDVVYEFDGTEFIGTPDELVERARRDGVHWLFVVGEAPRIASSPVLSSICQAFSEVVWVKPERSQACAGGSVVSCGLASGVRVEESLLRPSARIFKRAIDVTAAGSALLLLTPVFALIALAVYISDPGPIFFSHERIGRNGKKFKAWKFRSMVTNAKDILANYLLEHPELQAEWEKDHKLKNDPRITSIGKLIRKTSLDELPQLWNVLVGEMSLVGPRPIVDAEIEKYGPTFKQYLRVTPGISGLWQISGRNNTTYEERLAYDEFYVRHWSPWLDLYILMRTIRTVVFCEGAY
ncbi:MAG: undecaprenyl-phosphate galactose phosphotransferase WbaP [Aureliella sp.]